MAFPAVQVKSSAGGRKRLQTPQNSRLAELASDSPFRQAGAPPGSCMVPKACGMGWAPGQG